MADAQDSDPTGGRPLDSGTWERLETLFFEILEVPTQDRAEHLQKACPNDDGLREEVLAMLAAHESGDELRVEKVLLGSPDSQSETDDGRVGRRIGAWRLSRLLGRGGMGEVWLAERADGTYEKRAALKLVRSGWRASQLIPRFRRERQVLARLQHPNIATLLDGGVSEDGLPYLVMEYVDGEAITSWCRQNKTPVRKRIALFRAVCDAVRFAHSNLIVHRDLKPANILVTPEGRPVLLDFGIAKLLDPEEGDTLPTRIEERAMTPEYAAPEQVRGEAATTSTDVWALGTLLYELLSGTRPFKLEGKTPTEFERSLQEEDPKAPSAAAVDGDDARLLRGDLDRIVMKALRKEPERRYRSVEDLAEDLDRFLAGLPVRATPNSWPYRAKKFLRRNLGAVLAGAALAVMLVAFAVTSIVQSRHIAKERDAALAAESESEKAISMLVGLFSVANPVIHPGGDTLRVSEFLELAEEKFLETTDTPSLQAKLWRTLAQIHGERGRFEEQRAAIDRAIVAADSAKLEIDQLALFHEKARVILQMDGVEASAPLFRESLERHRKILNPDAADIAVCLQDLAMVTSDKDEKQSLLREALAIRQESLAKSASHGDSIGVASCLNAIGSAAWAERNMPEALSNFEKAHEIVARIYPDDHPNLLSVRNNVSVLLMHAGRYEESTRMLREIVASRRRIYGSNAPWVSAALNQLGVSLANEGKFAEAETVLHEAVAISDSTYGSNHDNTLAAWQDLALVLVHTDRSDRSFEILKDIRRAAVKKSGEGSARTIEADMALLRARQVSGNPASLAEVRRVVEQARGLSDTHDRVYARARFHQGVSALLNPEEALPRESIESIEDCLKGIVPGSDPLSPDVAQIRCALEVARAKSGETWSRENLATAYNACKDWGLAAREILMWSRQLLETPTSDGKSDLRPGDTSGNR